MEPNKPMVETIKLMEEIEGLESLEKIFKRACYVLNECFTITYTHLRPWIQSIGLD